MSQSFLARPTLSFIIPCYNEELALPKLRDRLLPLIAELAAEVEIILIDDGSSDATHELMLQFRSEDDRFKVLRFSRNFGHQAAISAGLDFCSGNAAVILDADLQDPPEVIKQMVARWKEGFAVVYGRRTARPGETVFKRFTAFCFYRILSLIVDFDLPENVGDFRLVDRKAIDAYKSFGEGSRFVRGLFSWLGFQQTAVDYARDERVAGNTKYPMRQMMRLALNAIVGFSDKPLRLATSLGIVLAVTSLFCAFLAVLCKVTGGFTVPGWTSLAALIGFIGGGQLFVLGIIGEYIGRICDEVRQRPLYIVEHLHGLTPPVNTKTRCVLPVDGLG